MVTVTPRMLKAATLVETILAMVIILAVFGMATSIIVQITARGTAIQKLKAESLLNEYIINTHSQMELFDQEINIDGFMVRRQIIDYKNRPGLKKICYQIYNDSGLSLERRNELFSVE